MEMGTLSSVTVSTLVVLVHRSRGRGIICIYFQSSTENADPHVKLMAVINAQSFHSTLWHPVSQTSLVAICKLTVPTYRVYCSD